MQGVGSGFRDLIHDGAGVAREFRIHGAGDDVLFLERVGVDWQSLSLQRRIVDVGSVEDEVILLCLVAVAGIGAETVRGLDYTGLELLHAGGIAALERNAFQLACGNNLLELRVAGLNLKRGGCDFNALLSALQFERCQYLAIVVDVQRQSRSHKVGKLRRRHRDRVRTADLERGKNKVACLVGRRPRRNPCGGVEGGDFCARNCGSAGIGHIAVNGRHRDLRKYLWAGEQQQKSHGYCDCCAAVPRSRGPQIDATDKELSTKYYCRVNALIGKLQQGRKQARDRLTSHKSPPNGHFGLVAGVGSITRIHLSAMGNDEK